MLRFELRLLAGEAHGQKREAVAVHFEARVGLTVLFVDVGGLPKVGETALRLAAVFSTRRRVATTCGGTKKRFPGPIVVSRRDHARQRLDDLERGHGRTAARAALAGRDRAASRSKQPPPGCRPGPYSP